MAINEEGPVLEPEEGDIALEEEEIALSNSELDDVLKSTSISSEPGAEAEDDLEQYGVWVKVEPQDVGVETDADMDFELADLDSGEETNLTDEEEQLLGELEEGSDSEEAEQAELGELAGLEEDLGELDAGGVEEELSVEDLDVDLEELGEEQLSVSEDLDAMDELPEMDLEPVSEEGEPDLVGGRALEIEVPLSDSTAVEEHYEDLAPLEGVPSTPGQSSPRASADILEKIERDLNQIKAEIQSLKNELAGIGRLGVAAGRVEVEPAPAQPEGFYQRGEEETIALTGDELDNVLASADVTEEIAEPEEPELADLGLEAPEEEQVMELGSLELEEEPEAAAEELSLAEMESAEEPIDIEIGDQSALEELILEEEPLAAAEETAEEAEEALEEISLEAAEEETPLIPDEELEAAEELVLDEDLEALQPEAEALEEISLEAAEEETPLVPDEELEAAEELVLDEDLEALQPEAEALEEISGEDSGVAADLEDFGEIEELVPEEAGVEPVLEEVEEIEELGLEEPSTEAFLEPALEAAEEIEGLDLEEIPAALTPETTGEEEILSVEQLSGEAEEMPELELAAEDLQVPPAQEAAEELELVPAGGISALPPELKKDIKSVLSYLDQLLEALPKEKIEEFAQSEYFGIYQRLFEDLGLGA